MTSNNLKILFSHETTIIDKSVSWYICMEICQYPPPYLSIYVYININMNINTYIYTYTYIYLTTVLEICPVITYMYEIM